MENSVRFEKFSFKKRQRSMLKVDFRRMFKSKLFYILIACALIMPVIMTVMMSMMDGSESVNQQTGEVTVIQGPENTWQNIGTLPDGEALGGMDVFSMCNINMMFMAVAVFVCLFISDDFKSGYAKNLFTVRAKKSDYVVSKIFSGFVCGSLMLTAYFIGAMLGGAISGLSFDTGELNAGNIAMCMIAKVFLMLVFVSVFTLISVAAKQRTWLSVCGSLGGGMILYMTVTMITPLSSTVVNAVLCLVGGVLFAVTFGVLSSLVLRKTSLV